MKYILYVYLLFLIIELKAQNVDKLKINFPNFGNILLAESDTLIQWEGISQNDSVSIEFSNDNGNSWKQISRNAKGLKHLWRNIPLPESNNCLMRMSTFEKLNFPDSVPKFVWSRTLGGKNSDIAYSLVSLNDGTFISVGKTFSQDGDVVINKGAYDIIVNRIDEAGNVVWSKTYGANLDDIAFKVIRTLDNNLLIVGQSNSTNGDLTSNNGEADILILKIDLNGNFLWAKNYGGSKSDFASDVIQTLDGGYLIGANSYSSDFDVQSNRGETDFYLIKIDANGNKLWTQSYGGNDFDQITSLIVSDNNSYIVTGISVSKNGEVGVNKGLWDAWIIKIDLNGNILWSKVIGGNRSDYANSIIKSADNNFIIAGSSSSSNGDLSNNRGGSDAWIFKIDIDGNKIWSKIFGGIQDDRVSSIVQSNDSKYIVAGTSSSSEIDLKYNNGNEDAWIFKIDENGNLVWSNSFGGSNTDVATAVYNTQNNSYILTGYSESNDVMINKNQGLNDILFLKVASSGNILSDTTSPYFSIIAPKIESIDIDLLECNVGLSKDSTISDYLTNSNDFTVRVDSIYIRGADASSFKLKNKFTKLYLLPKANLSLEFTFIPAHFGMHNAETVIISQADTIYKQIYGMGLAANVEIIANEILIGKSYLNRFKDTISAFTIKNNGNANLLISNLNVTGTNQSNFQILSTITNHILKANDTLLVNFRFQPSFIGLADAILEIDHHLSNSPTKIILKGEGIIDNARIKSISDTTWTLVCNETQIVKINVSNEGTKDLIINNLSLTGVHSDEYEILSNLPITIKENEIIDLEINLKPKSLGLKYAKLNISSNSEPFPELEINLSYLKEESKYDIEYSVINLENICSNQLKDTSIIITNKGTTRVVYKVEYSSSFSSLNYIDSIEVNESRIIVIPISKLTKFGELNEIITIQDLECNKIQIVDIIANILNPHLELENLIIESILMKETESKILIRNPNQYDITITELKGIQAPFELLENNFPLIIKENEFIELKIRYSPISINLDELELRIIGTPCDFSQSFKILGDPSSIGQLSIENTKAFAGEEIEVKIVLDALDEMKTSGLNGLEFELKFNPTLIYPLQYTANSIDDTSASIHLYVPLSSIESTSILAKIKFKVALGNAAESLLELSNLKLSNSSAKIVTTSGSLKLLGVCYEGGARLINPSGQAAQLLSISPNPAENWLDLEVSLIEEGATEIAIFNIKGEKVKTLLNEEIETTGIFNLSSDLQNLSSGQYYIILKTPTYIETNQLMIVK